MTTTGSWRHGRDALTAVAPPPNSGHMSRVYEAVVPGIRDRVIQWLGEHHAPWGDWGFSGGGISSVRSGLVPRHSPLRLWVDAGTRIGGKAVNQDAIGWRVFGQGADAMAVISVADGLSSSLYSEFGSALAVAGSLRIGTGWLAGHTARPLSAALLGGLDETREAMQDAVRTMRVALDACAGSSKAGADRRAGEEARRQLDILADRERAPLCTTVLLVAVGSGRAAGVAVGNGALYRYVGGETERIWWETERDEVPAYIGPRELPDQATFSFEEPWDACRSGGYGAATDGVGRFESFSRARRCFADGCVPAGSLLDAVLEDMGHRRVSFDLIDNLTVAEIGAMGGTPREGETRCH